MRVGREFTNPSNVALQPGLTEENLKGAFRLGGTELRAEHAYQEFELQGVSREHTGVGLVQAVTPAVHLDAGVTNDQVGGGSVTPSEVTASELTAKWQPSPKLQIWGQGRRHLSLSGPDVSPELWGFGATYRVAPAVALEASQRYVPRPARQGAYSVSNLGLPADLALETHAWGRHQLRGGLGGFG